MERNSPPAPIEVDIARAFFSQSENSNRLETRAIFRTNHSSTDRIHDERGRERKKEIESGLEVKCNSFSVWLAAPYQRE